jgi:hypothetical protein
MSDVFPATTDDERDPREDEKLMRNEKQRLKGISPHTMVDFFGESAIQK